MFAIKVVYKQPWGRVVNGKMFDGKVEYLDKRSPVTGCYNLDILPRWVFKTAKAAQKVVDAFLSEYTEEVESVEVIGKVS